MPVMVFYKSPVVPLETAKEIAEALGELTATVLEAKIEVRVIEPLYSYNSNEVHIEMRFRDFNEYSDKQIADYHTRVLKTIGKVVEKHSIKCQYSFYIIPSSPPRSMWAQAKNED